MAKDQQGGHPSTGDEREVGNGRERYDETKTRRSVDDYQVGLICALDSEMAAMTAMLDEEHEMLDFQDPSDNNSYALGRIHKHNVVVACLPAGIYGTTSAAVVAKDMLNTFKSIKFGLMVGIGGGIPLDGKNDIRLGDIVVSQPTNKSGGVIQHDFGKIKDGEQEIELKGSLNTPPTILLTALTQLKAQHLRKRSLIPNYLNEMIKNNPMMEENGYVFPGSQYDQLYNSNYRHQSADTNNCEHCDKLKVITRHPRTNSTPKIHYGIISSGNQVIKDPKERDRIAAQLGALCIEMEAAGLMNNFPCIVIRGICDYVDSHKNKQWQPYAASTAAAFAKELLLFVSPARVSNEKAFQSTIEELKIIGSEQLNITKDHIHQKNLQYNNDRFRACHLTFKPNSSYEAQKDINPPRSPQTCRWAFEHEQFQKWYNSEKDDLLWISADPGCGKSVLSRSFVDEQLEASNYTACYFFFKDNEAQDQLSVALSAILHQLFSHQPKLLEYAMIAWEKHQNTIQNETAELWRILISVSKHSSSTIICVFDALDECREDDKKVFISLVSKFYKESCMTARKDSHLKFLITSRPYADIELGFKDIPLDLPNIRLSGEQENDTIKQEIKLVLEQRIQKLGQDLKLKEETIEKLQDKLLAMKHRTYLWLHLAISGIETTYRDSFQLNPGSEALDLLPSSVEDAYEKILQKVSSQNYEKVQVIFQIVVGSRRPMTVRELAIAYGIAVKDLNIDENKFQKAIPQLCGLFIFINHSTVYLIHQTANEFLLKTDRTAPSSRWIGHEIFKKCDTLLADACIRFLLLEDLTLIIENDESRKREGDDVESKENSHGLLDYASEHWPGHFREADLHENLVNNSCLLYDTDDKRFHSWFKIFWRVTMMFNSPVNQFRSNPPKVPGATIAAYNGHTAALISLKSQDATRHVVSGEGDVPMLIFAVTGGHIATVQLLIEKGADVNALGENYGNALIVASSGGHQSIVQLLIEKGADVNAQGGHYGNALQAASSRGHQFIVQLLIEKGADVNAQGGYYGNALMAALSGGHQSIVQLLIEKGADVNAQGGREYGNALQAASEGGHQSIVQLLIEKGADINGQGSRYGNALQAASSRGHQSIVQLLIEKGADVNAQGGRYGNALQAASIGGHQSIVQLLIEKGANINGQGSRYGNALQAALEFGHESIVQLLIEKGADVNGDALQAASRYGHQSIVQLLIEKGVDVNAQGGKYGNALQAASEFGHESIVQLLIEKGADVNGDALQAASRYGHQSIVQLLIEKGVDVNAQGGKYGNALQAASAGGHKSIV